MGLVDTLFQNLLKKKTQKKPSPTDAPPSPRPNLHHQPIILQAKAQAKEIILKAKEEALQIKENIQRDLQKQRAEVEKIKERILRKEAELDRLRGRLEERSNFIKSQEDKLQKQLDQIEDLKKRYLQKIEEVSGLSKQEAKDLLLKGLEKSLIKDMAKMIQMTEQKAKEEAEAKTKEILATALVHGAIDYVPEYTVSVIKLPSEDMKARIIGREGRNIRTFTKATGVDLEIDETPDSIRISSFDPVRREIARVALQKLISDGRIQPSRIEEIVAKTKTEIEKIMYQAGEELCHKVKVYNLPRQIVQVLGRFKYRYSYGQNMIAHTLEETKIGIALAHELKVDVNTVRLGCLLHDIGKVISDREGSHVEIGVEFLSNFDLPKAVINAVAEHHEDKPFSSVESMIVYVADAVSGARPGARYEDYTEYVKRLRSLEETAQKFKGVKEAYALQAGREVRVVVDPSIVDDAQLTVLTRKIKDAIEKQLTFPGNVVITAIRETRAKEVIKAKH
ncbi:MAG: ribonuclease Y [bacterium]|nr:ribonuclease Y [bacterium]